MTGRASGPSDDVVLVHGLWFGGPAMSLLARRLQRAGFRPRTFSYSTTREKPERQLAALFDFAALPSGALPHFVAHSMGGLVTLKLMEKYAEAPSGRVVLIGTPLQGSAIAREIRHWPGGRHVLGTAGQTLIEGAGPWPLDREVGMIAGTRSLGLGILAGAAAHRGDGTVLVDETRHEGLQGHIEVRATHTGLLFSAEAARQAAAFLRHGRFA